jgi:hypothetical protein
MNGPTSPDRRAEGVCRTSRRGTFSLCVQSPASITVRARGSTHCRGLIGIPGSYRSFDCSGFTRYVYRKVIGVGLPHKADLQQRYGRPVDRSQARPGDLIVIRDGSYGHRVGIYAGQGYMYDAPRAGETIGKHRIWSSNYVVRRLAAWARRGVRRLRPMRAVLGQSLAEAVPRPNLHFPPAERGLSRPTSPIRRRPRGTTAYFAR